MSLYTLIPHDDNAKVQRPRRVTVREAGTDRTVVVVEETDEGDGRPGRAGREDRDDGGGGAVKFKVEIKLGNEAMSEGWDVGDALRKIAAKVEDEIGSEELTDRLIGSEMPVTDGNGNTVGSAGFEAD